MKARLLKQLLNTDRVTGDYGDYIAVGSGLCHRLITIDKATLTLKYALGDVPRHDEELMSIWNKLQELIKSGAIKEIIEGADVIENPLPVFTINDDGEVHESITDAYGYPNTDNNGVVMHDSTHFSNREDAVRYGVKAYSISLKWRHERLMELKEKVKKVRQDIKRRKQIIASLRSQL